MSDRYLVLIQDRQHHANMYVQIVFASSRSNAAMNVEMNMTEFDFDLDYYQIVAVGRLVNDDFALMRRAIRSTSYEFEGMSS